MFNYGRESSVRKNIVALAAGFLLLSIISSVKAGCFKVDQFTSTERTCIEESNESNCVKYSNWGVFPDLDSCCQIFSDKCTDTGASSGSSGSSGSPFDAGTYTLGCFDSDGASQAIVTTLDIITGPGNLFGMVAAPDSSAVYFSLERTGSLERPDENYVLKMITSSPYTVTAVAGGYTSGDDNVVDGNGLDAQFTHSLWGMAISPDGQYLYVGESYAVRRIDLNNDNTVTTIHTDPELYADGMDVSADGNTLYFTNYGGAGLGKILSLNLESSSSTITLVADGFDGPVSLVVVDDNTLLVGVELVGSGDTDDNIYKVTIDTGVTDSFSAGYDNVRGMSISADKKVLYVSDTYNDQIYVIDMTQSVIQKKILAGTFNLRGHVDAIGVNARFDFPMSSAPLSDGRLFVCDSNNMAIRSIECPS